MVASVSCAGFHTLLDGEPCLPEATLHQRPDRCREVGMPGEFNHRRKWTTTLEQLRRATTASTGPG